MTEAEILDLITQNTDSLWGLIQWWASVSLAIIATGHIAGEKLKGPILGTIIATYTLYTIMIASEIVTLSGTLLSGLFQDLTLLSQQNVLGNAGQSMLELVESQRESTTRRGITLYGTGVSIYIITIGYLIYCYREHQNRNN